MNCIFLKIFGQEMVGMNYVHFWALFWLFKNHYFCYCCEQTSWMNPAQMTVQVICAGSLHLYVSCFKVELMESERLNERY